MTRLFLDCEWADAEGEQLVSLALVSEDGAHRFYSEIQPLPDRPTDFVRAHVYPLLERGGFAVSEREFTHRLRTFFIRLGADCEVCYDNMFDGRLLLRALDGFQGMPAPMDILPAGIVTGLFADKTISLTLSEVEGETGRIEIRPKIILDAAVQQNLEHYFASRPDAAARRHHAGVDADGLRWAFLRAAKG